MPPRTPAACSAAAVPARQAGLCATAACCQPAPAGRLLHPVLTTLPSLLGWQPFGTASSCPWQPYGSAIRMSSARGSVPWRPLELSAPARAYTTLSDSISITPAIEAQLQRIEQRHTDLMQQLSGDAMSRWVLPCLDGCALLCRVRTANAGAAANRMSCRASAFENAIIALQLSIKAHQMQLTLLLLHPPPRLPGWRLLTWRASTRSSVTWSPSWRPCSSCEPSGKRYKAPRLPSCQPHGRADSVVCMHDG